MPIAICSSVSGPPGSTTVQGPRPTCLGCIQTQATYPASPSRMAKAAMRFSQAGS